MHAELETQILLALTRKAMNRPEEGLTSLHELLQDARKKMEGTDREARAARAVAEVALSVLHRYGPILAGLADEEGKAAIERERGRWEEIVDAARARLAHGGPILVLSTQRRRQA